MVNFRLEDLILNVIKSDETGFYNLWIFSDLFINVIKSVILYVGFQLTICGVQVADTFLIREADDWEHTEHWKQQRKCGTSILWEDIWFGPKYETIQFIVNIWKDGAILLTGC